MTIRSWCFTFKLVGPCLQQLSKIFDGRIQFDVDGVEVKTVHLFAHPQFEIYATAIGTIGAAVPLIGGGLQDFEWNIIYHFTRQPYFGSIIYGGITFHLPWLIEKTIGMIDLQGMCISAHIVSVHGGTVTRTFATVHPKNKMVDLFNIGLSLGGIAADKTFCFWNVFVRKG